MTIRGSGPERVDGEHAERVPIRRLVLDAQGVVLNAPLDGFLDELARRTDQAATAVRSRWQRDLRLRAWTGTITDDELWDALTSGARDIAPGALLESRFASGPAAAHLPRWHRRVSIWLLSNHRTHWLLPRLRRFRLAGWFDRILVSDALGAAKPARAAIEPIVAGLRDPRSVLFVDDKQRNVRAAGAMGLTVLHADPSVDWIARVDAALAASIRDVDPRRP